MNLHNHRFLFLFPAFVLCSFFLMTGCGYERIGSNPSIGESGEYYDQASVMQMTFDDFCMSVFREELAKADTLDLHYILLDPQSYGITPGEVSLGTYRIEDMIHDTKDVKALKERLSSFDREVLTDEQQAVYDALLETINTTLMADGLELYDQPLAPTIGIQAQLPILLAEYAFYSIQDIENYLTLLTQIDRYYGEILQFEFQKADAGLVPSDATLDAIIASCKCYLIDPENNFLTETFDSRIANMSSTSESSDNSVPLTEEQISAFKERHISAIKNHFIPAYEALIQGLNNLKGRGLNDGGLAGFRNGKAYYEYLLKSGSGLSYSIPELKTALSARMQSDLEAINHLYLQHPDLNELIAASAFTLTDPIQILEDLKQQMSSDFPSLPDCNYEINYVPSHLEESLSPAFYLTAPLDNADHNVIYINNGYPDSAAGLYTTLAHEGFPGHLYQTVYNQMHASTPLMSLLSCSGANEGWATYVENYACTIDNGLPEAVGTYRALVRSFSLCVHGMLDIGIHYDGWTKEQAAAFITSCFQVDEETIDQLWQTIIDNPANYLEYCGGYLEILEMREQAELALGEHFSLLEFHRFLLDIGPVPFSVIRNQFQLWLQEQNELIKS